MYIFLIITLVVTMILYIYNSKTIYVAADKNSENVSMKQDSLKNKLQELVDKKTPKAMPIRLGTTLKPIRLGTPRPIQLTPRKGTPRPIRYTQQPQRGPSRFQNSSVTGQLKSSYQPGVKNMVNSFLDNNDTKFKSSLNSFLSQNSTADAVRLTACNTDNPTLDDIICNIKFQYKIQSFI